MSDESEENSGEFGAIEFDIRIVNEDGEGIGGECVNLTYSYLTDFVWTDDDGWAHFSKPTLIQHLCGGISVSKIQTRDCVLAEDIFIENGDSLSYTI